MSRVEKTVFVSYRRTNEAWAVAVFGDITHIGYDVFIDYDGIASGNFEAAILENIKARAHFLVLLIPTALKRDPNDWMRREIEAALDSDRNIVPLMFPGFDFGTSATASQLTGKLAEFKQYNRMPIPASFFFEAMVRLRKFLNVPVRFGTAPRIRLRSTGCERTERWGGEGAGGLPSTVAENAPRKDAKV